MKKSIVQRIDLAEGIDTSNLFGHVDNHLRIIERGLDVNLFARGEEVVIEGEAAAVRRAGKVIGDLSDLAREGVRLTPEDVEHAVHNSAQGTFESEPTVKELAAEAIVVANKKKILPKSPAQKEYVESMRRHDIVVAIGPAGTGKTYLGMAMAVSAFLAREVSRIILVRPAVEAGEKLGFLPGDIAAKVNPYLRPLYDALYDMMEFERANRLMERGDIEIAPLAYMRGRTLNDSFIILDEAQNATSEQMKMFLTRLGYHSKIVVTGDITQVDLPTERISGLIEIQAILDKVPGIRFAYFTEKDVVRHRLVQDIIKAYERYEEKSGKRRR